MSASSSGENDTFSAPRFSRRRSTRRVPGIVKTSPPCARTQASATCAIVAPFFAAMSRMSSTKRIFTASAAGLFALARDSFSKSLLVTVAVIAVLLSSVAISLLHRDANAGAELAAAVASDQGSRALVAELARVAVVISKYDGYRYFVSALGSLH